MQRYFEIFYSKSRLTRFCEYVLGMTLSAARLHYWPASRSVDVHSELTTSGISIDAHDHAHEQIREPWNDNYGEIFDPSTPARKLHNYKSKLPLKSAG
jgi:hypothetical protein